MQSGSCRASHAASFCTRSAHFRTIETRYAAWYRDLERNAIRADNEALSGFYSRLSVAALKMAALLELAQSGRFEVSLGALEEALGFADYLAAVVRHLLRVEFAMTEDDRRPMRVLAVITKWPGCTRKDILQRTHYSAKQLTEALYTLHQRGDVEIRGGQHWPKVDG